MKRDPSKEMCSYENRPIPYSLSHTLPHSYPTVDAPIAEFQARMSKEMYFYEKRPIKTDVFI